MELYERCSRKRSAYSGTNAYRILCDDVEHHTITAGDPMKIDWTFWVSQENDLDPS